MDYRRQLFLEDLAQNNESGRRLYKYRDSMFQFPKNKIIWLYKKVCYETKTTAFSSLKPAAVL